MIIKDSRSSVSRQHRILMRTENSLEKVIAAFPYMHLKKMKKQLHQELRTKSFLNKILSDPHINYEVREKSVSAQEEVKVKSKSIKNMFKNAHVAFKNQSFLPRKKEKSSATFNWEKNLLERRTLSSKTVFNFQGESMKNHRKQVLSEQKKCKTITYVEDSKKYRKKVNELKRSGSSQPLQQQISIKINKQPKAYSLFSNQYTQNSTKVNNNEEVNNKQCDYERKQLVEAEGQANYIPQGQNTIETRQMLTPAKPDDHKRREEKEQTKIKAANLIPSNKETTRKKSAKQASGSKKQKTNRQKLYQQASLIDFLDIAEIKFEIPSVEDAETISFQQDKKVNDRLTNNSKKEQDKAKETLEVTDLDFVLPNQEVSKSKVHKSNHQKNKSSIKIKKSTSKFLEKYNLESNEPLQEERFDKKNKKEEINVSKYQPAIIEPVNQEKQTQKQDQSNKTRYTSLLRQIGIMKYRLELHGELATFFSQNSKMFKQNQESQEFLRESGGLKWHKLVFLFFKYFQTTFLLFEECYRKGATYSIIKEEQFKVFSQQNKLLADSLVKIEKSVRKHASLNPQDQNQLFAESPRFDSIDVAALIQELRGRSEGKSREFSFFDNLSKLIMKEAVKVVKSLFLSKILSSKSTLAIKYKEGVFRILNACSILHLFQHQKAQLKIEPLYNIQDLKNPQIELFKQFYESTIRQIFIKV